MTLSGRCYQCFLQHDSFTHWTNQSCDGHCGHRKMPFFLFFPLTKKKKSNRSDACQRGHKFWRPPFSQPSPKLTRRKLFFPYVCTSWPLLGPRSSVFISLLLLPSCSGILSFTAQALPPVLPNPLTPIAPGRLRLEEKAAATQKGWVNPQKNRIKWIYAPPVGMVEDGAEFGGRESRRNKANMISALLTSAWLQCKYSALGLTSATRQALPPELLLHPFCPPFPFPTPLWTTDPLEIEKWREGYSYDLKKKTEETAWDSRCASSEALPTSTLLPPRPALLEELLVMSKVFKSSPVRGQN